MRAMSLGSVADADRVLHVSADAAVRRDAALAFLRSLPPAAPALILVPSPNAGLRLVADALPPGAARWAWERRTLEVHAHALALPALAADGCATVSGLGAQALCAHVLHGIEPARLGRFAAVSGKPGFVRALHRTLDELRLARVPVASVAGRDPALAACYEAYCEALAAARLADRAQVFALALRALPEDSAAPPLLALDVAVEHAAAAELVAGLCRGSERVCATAPHGERRHAGAWSGLRELVHAPRAAGQLGRLQARLFETEVAGAAEDEKEPVVRFVSSPGESREAVEVARGVLEHAARGVPFDRMAVLLRDVDSYRAVLEEAFTRARVPAFFADGVRRPAPEGRAFAALLACAQTGLSARRFAEYLSIGAFPRAQAEQPALGPRHWERMLVDAAVVGGRARWARRLRGLARETEAELQLTAADERERLERKLAALMQLEAFALPLLDLLEGLPRRAPFSVWLPALEALAARALGDPSRVIELLLELAPLGDRAPLGLDEIVRLLAPRLNTLLRPSTGHGAGQVFVASIDEARGRSFDCVFVLGLAEKLFPARLGEDPLLPDATRRALSPALTTMEERVAGERLALRLAVGAASAQLCLSFPRFDSAHGRPRVPSFYGLEVLQALWGRLPGWGELTLHADPGAAARRGWPAPPEPARAIDDAEYDLALLEQLQTAPALAPGAARYLLNANPHLARALRFRARRWQLPRFVAADGFVAGEAASALLAPLSLRERSYSATALAHFAACPYRFYLYAIARVSEREQVADVSELDARQRGVLFHEVLRRTTEALQRAELLPLTAANSGAARGLLTAAFEQVVSEAREQYAPPIARVFDSALVALRADLEGWLSRLEHDGTWSPLAAEQTFGRRAGAADEPLLIEPGLSLAGAIDLVEMHEQRSSDGRRLLRATDYKTSSDAERLGVTNGGRVLQPLLYALALERLYPDAQVAGGRLYFCTTRGHFASQDVPLDDDARAIARELVTSIDELVRAGLLPAAPAEGACQRCSYRAICGPDEEERVARVKARDAARLRNLQRVRRLP
jgi:CRISPR/Cas system-associated exonuclease Cas4 (RecB family)